MTSAFRHPSIAQLSQRSRRLRMATAALQLAALVPLAAAASGSAQAAAAAAPSPDQRETARLNAWLDAKYEEELALSPIARSFQGDKTAQDKIDDMSEAAGNRRLAWMRRSVAQLRAKFDRAKLAPDARLSYDLWIYRYEDAARLAAFPRNVYVYDQLFGAHTRLAQVLLAAHNVDAPADMAAYITRIGEIRRAQLQLLAIAKRNAAAGARVPRFAYETMVAGLSGGDRLVRVRTAQGRRDRDRGRQAAEWRGLLRRHARQFDHHQHVGRPDPPARPC